MQTLKKSSNKTKKIEILENIFYENLIEMLSDKNFWACKHFWEINNFGYLLVGVDKNTPFPAMDVVRGD